jgi:hypothetical protein
MLALRELFNVVFNTSTRPISRHSLSSLNIRYFTLTYRRDTLSTVIGSDILLDRDQRRTSSLSEGFDGSSSKSSVTWHFY